MEIDWRRHFIFSQWSVGSDASNTDYNEPEETETPKFRLSSSELHNEFFNSVKKSYAAHKQCRSLMSLLQQKYRFSELGSQLEEPWLRHYKNKSFLINGLLYHRWKHTPCTNSDRHG
ncbi:hypothetical protein O181_118956 [Austropuccinia psidii MF-1]|uniref:Uncharacterized protein n=1 Tax=Austropuccinia psidii MF-1 TaxID=1389203 RepID=A0A9Q3KEU0_9BASI|nr:hypothetical protein [Austropuccinia psidii MF-1]